MEFKTQSMATPVMGSGADAAIEAADVVFMNPSVQAVPDSIAIARATGKMLHLQKPYRNQPAH